MAKSATPFLTFQHDDAEAAMALYVSLFPDGAITRLTRWPAGAPGHEGKVMQAEFTVAGQRFFCSDSPPNHAFDFTPSMSIFVGCSSEAELDSAYATLREGGRTLMPPGNYGFSKHFAWVEDRFKVSWQLNLA